MKLESSSKTDQLAISVTYMLLKQGFEALWCIFPVKAFFPVNNYCEMLPSRDIIIEML